jgi:hypothetical protein
VLDTVSDVEGEEGGPDPRSKDGDRGEGRPTRRTLSAASCQARHQMMSQRRGEEVVEDDDEGGGLKEEKRSEDQVDSKTWRTLVYKQDSLIY